MRKRVLITFALLLVGCSIIGCGVKSSASPYYKNSTAVETQAGGKLERVNGNNVCSEWRDTETGVHYFYCAYGGLTVRLNADGTPFVD